MLRKNIIILVSFVLLAMLLSFSVTAQAQAYANSSQAIAWATGDGSFYIFASARISNLLSNDGGLQEGNRTYAEARGYASNLYNVQYYPVTSSRAGSWDGSYNVSDLCSNKNILGDSHVSKKICIYNNIINICIYNIMFV